MFENEEEAAAYYNAEAAYAYEQEMTALREEEERLKNDRLILLNNIFIGTETKQEESLMKIQDDKGNEFSYIKLEPYSSDMLNNVLQISLRLLTNEQRKELIINLQERIGTEPKGDE